MDTDELIKKLAARRPAAAVRSGRLGRARPVLPSLSSPPLPYYARPEAGHCGRRRNPSLSLQVRGHDYCCRERLRGGAGAVAAGRRGARRLRTRGRPGALAAGIIVDSLFPAGPMVGEAGRHEQYGLPYLHSVDRSPARSRASCARYGTAPRHDRPCGRNGRVLAGGIAATLYAAHCTDDSPLFVATWYTIAIAGTCHRWEPPVPIDLPGGRRM